jgi:hypothetical protein
MRRTIIVVGMVVVGFALQTVTFLFLAAPLGTPSDVGFSEPRVPFAPALFILGVVLVFAAALVYELTPDREER